MSTCDELANKINRNGPLAVRAIKELAYKGMDMDLGQGIAFEKLLSDRISTTEDAKEGPLAFTEKREAAYKGR
jgi:enoyl-CoA hydratase/carnithine racemase